jgi:hypothetical protein
MNDLTDKARKLATKIAYKHATNGIGVEDISSILLSVLQAERNEENIVCLSGSGMSLRDYFAGQALASGDCPYNGFEIKERANWCYSQADAMIAKREKS